MITLNKNMQNIRRFFYDLYYNDEMSSTETINFFNECIEFVLKQNNLNPNNYNIQIHTIQTWKKDQTQAFMRAEDKNNTNYHIFLKSNAVKYKGRNYTDPEKQNEQLGNFIETLISFLHEMGHIVQYITDEFNILEYDHSIVSIECTIDQFNDCKNKTERLINSYLKKHLNSMEFISNYEKNANAQAFRYFKRMLDLIIIKEKDVEFVDFLSSIYGYINSLRQDLFTEYRQQHQFNKFAVAKLISFGIGKELLIQD